MEEVLKQILNELKDLKQGQTRLEAGQTKLEEAQSLLLKLHFQQEDKTDSKFEELNTKLDKIYINTTGIAKNFEDTTQEVAVMTRQVRGHEDRITELEEKKIA